MLPFQTPSCNLIFIGSDDLVKNVLYENLKNHLTCLSSARLKRIPNVVIGESSNFPTIFFLCCDPQNKTIEELEQDVQKIGKTYNGRKYRIYLALTQHDGEDFSEWLGNLQNTILNNSDLGEHIHPNYFWVEPNKDEQPVFAEIAKLVIQDLQNFDKPDDSRDEAVQGAMTHEAGKSHPEDQEYTPLAGWGTESADGGLESAISPDDSRNQAVLSAMTLERVGNSNKEEHNSVAGWRAESADGGLESAIHNESESAFPPKYQFSKEVPQQAQSDYDAAYNQIKEDHHSINDRSKESINKKKNLIEFTKKLNKVALSFDNFKKVAAKRKVSKSTNDNYNQTEKNLQYDLYVLDNATLSMPQRIARTVVSFMAGVGTAVGFGLGGLLAGTAIGMAVGGPPAALVGGPSGCCIGTLAGFTTGFLGTYKAMTNMFLDRNYDKAKQVVPPLEVSPHQHQVDVEPKTSHKATYIDKTRFFAANVDATIEAERKTCIAPAEEKYPAYFSWFDKLMVRC